MSEDTVGIKHIETENHDPFEGCTDLVNVFTGIADYLSLWCELYGLREDQIVYERPQWATGVILAF